LASQGIQLNEEKLCCSICLDLLKDPVTIPCGHNYCKNCIKSFWEEKCQKKRHSCPQCRQTFRSRPVLVKNTMLAELVEEVKKTGLQAAPADHCYRKAAKSCLQCQVSSCEQHLQPHYEVAPLKKHKLVNPSANIQENIQQRIQDREKDVVVLQQEVEAINRSADKAVRDSDEIFNELVHVIRKRSSGVKHLIKSRQKNELSRVKELQKKLQQEITELRRKDAELEKLSQTEDHTQLFHNFPSLSNLTESTNSPSINIRPPRCFEDVTAAVSEVGDKLQDILKEDWMKICMNDRSLTDTDADVLLPPAEPKTRAEFLQYSKQITLDPNTAHTEVALSEGNRKATNMEVSQLYSPQPDRFTDMFQVLSRESLTRRCYWEVEWSGGGVSVAVTYKDIINFAGRQSSTIGVFMDHKAGILSFYEVSKTITLLHKVQTTFTQPLHVGLGVCYFGSTAEFCEVK
uniref:RING-type domain-containing protein n=1 Tax=Seriola lalandi dorsalis TaxID=1841481 RepID=A0A3B4XWI1_SERLL